MIYPQTQTELDIFSSKNADVKQNTSTIKAARPCHRFPQPLWLTYILSSENAHLAFKSHNRKANRAFSPIHRIRKPGSFWKRIASWLGFLSCAHRCTFLKGRAGVFLWLHVWRPEDNLWYLPSGASQYLLAMGLLVSLQFCCTEQAGSPTNFHPLVSTSHLTAQCGG